MRLSIQLTFETGAYNYTGLLRDTSSYSDTTGGKQFFKKIIRKQKIGTIKPEPVTPGLINILTRL
jgi:hypothetical protein